jgi:hypothetical protein
MRWRLSWRADPAARAIADRHYNRQKVGAAQFVPPGRCVVLLSVCGRALWVSAWPFAQYVQHAWAGAWMNSLFRNEGAGLSSELIVEAEAATRAIWGDPPPLGFVTFVDAGEVRSTNPGYCYRMAGWKRIGSTKAGLLAWGRPAGEAPAAAPPLGYQARLIA